MELGASSTQTIYASRPSTNHSRKTIEEALDNLTAYYQVNSLRNNPEKIQVTAFHLRNKEAKGSQKVVWNQMELENTTHPKYLGVSLDRSLQTTHSKYEDEGGYP